nr:protein SIEVE ELEMENT OCCLUSION B-like [Ipomoea trifida]
MATQPIPLSQPLILQPTTSIDDDTAIANQVMATHHPNAYGATNLNANFVLSYAKNILNFNHLVYGEVEKDIFMPQKLIHKELLYQMIQLSFAKYGIWILENKRLLLMIVSDTNLSEATFLCHHLSRFEINPLTILIPIIDYPQVWTDAWMPSASIINQRLKLLDPCKRITPQFIRFVKERWVPSFQSGGEPIVISLDSRGRLVHTNALHMMLTWRADLAIDTLTVGSGNNIISLLQKELTEMTLNVGSVIDDIEKRKCDFVNRIRKTIDDWRNDINRRIKDSSEGKYDIFFCGGNDAKYIQEFATKVKEVNSEIQLDIKFAYIGNNKKANSLVKNISGYAFRSTNAEYLWFWTRLRSAFLSRITYLNKTSRIEDEDKIFLGLQKLLAYEANSTTFGAWVLLSKGKEVVACDLGDKMMRVMNAYQKWKNNIGTKGFSQAFKDCYEKFASSQDQHSCCMLEYPLTLNKIPEDVKCPQAAVVFSSIAGGTYSSCVAVAQPCHPDRFLSWCF